MKIEELFALASKDKMEAAKAFFALPRENRHEILFSRRALELVDLLRNEINIIYPPIKDKK